MIKIYCEIIFCSIILDLADNCFLCFSILIFHLFSGESFASDEAWNWGMDDTKQSSSSVQSLSKDEPTDSQNVFPASGQEPKLPVNVNPLKYSPGQESSLLHGKRGKLDTPQWSTESQMSQESSDLQTSESDKSHVSHSPMAPSQFVDDIS